MKRSIAVAIAVVIVLIIAGTLTAYYLGLFAAPRARYPLELWYNNDGHYGDTEDELATVLKSSIESCGRVAVTLRSDPWAVYRQNWAAGTMPLFLLGWYPDYFDSDDYISPFLTISGARSLGSRYNNSQVEQWIIEEQTTSDPAVRSSRFSQIQDRLGQDVPYLPLFSGNAHVAYVAGISNIVLHPVSFKWFIMDKPAATVLTGSTTDRIISLDPADAYDYFSIEVINQIFDTLLVYEPVQSRIMPGLATEVPTVANGGITNGGRTYTFHLKPGVTFHDGTALNSTVVKRSIDRVIRLDLPASAAFLLYDVGALGRDPTNGNNTAVGTIETPDPLTVVFNLARPVSFFNDLMAFSVSAPVPLTYSQTGVQPATVGNVIGTGPYRMTQHTENQLVVFDRFLNYHSPALYQSFGIPSIPVEDQVTVNIRASATALKNDIETRQVDVVYRTLTPTDLTDLQNRAGTLGITVTVGASPQIRYLVFQTETITDVRIRQAIAYSVDRAAIDNVVFNGQAVPLYSMLPPELPYHSPVFQTRYGAVPNCAQANALLAQVGFSLGFGARELIARDI